MNDNTDSSNKNGYIKSDIYNPELVEKIAFHYKEILKIILQGG
jgi:hypothetical protein